MQPLISRSHRGSSFDRFQAAACSELIIYPVDVLAPWEAMEDALHEVDANALAVEDSLELRFDNFSRSCLRATSVVTWGGIKYSYVPNFK
jgi:hypothetical protein